MDDEPTPSDGDDGEPGDHWSFATADRFQPWVDDGAGAPYGSLRCGGELLGLDL